jgi:predicted GIY-YIG superfamily endonuclease
MGAKRAYQRYKVHVKGQVVHGGITTDFPRRKVEHKRDYPNSIIRKVGSKVSEKTARDWEKDEGYT